nr:MAG TPA: hypothetical protein [Crassvirales sp.]
MISISLSSITAIGSNVPTSSILSVINTFLDLSCALSNKSISSCIVIRNLFYIGVVNQYFLLN